MNFFKNINEVNLKWNLLLLSNSLFINNIKHQKNITS